jgi:hypothetical protein
MIAGLTLSVAATDAIALISDTTVDRILFHPLHMLGLFVACFVVAPRLSARFPIKRSNNLP